MEDFQRRGLGRGGAVRMEWVWAFSLEREALLCIIPGYIYTASCQNG
jgi:hypothetical protein